MNIHSKTPEDFPYSCGASGLSGIAPKFSAHLHEGRYFLIGSMPQERESQYSACLDLVKGYTQNRSLLKPHYYCLCKQYSGARRWGNE